MVNFTANNERGELTKEVNYWAQVLEKYLDTGAVVKP